MMNEMRPTVGSGALMTGSVQFTVAAIPKTCRRIACLITIAIFEPIHWASFSAIGHRPRQVHLEAPALSVEVIRVDGFAHKNVVVEVEESLRETCDSVQMRFDCRRTECRQMTGVDKDLL